MVAPVISSAVPRWVSYDAAAGQTQFPIAFAYLDQEDIRIDVFRGVTRIASYQGGDGTMACSPAADGALVDGVAGTATIPACAQDDVVTVYGLASPEREAAYTQTGQFRAELINRELNRRVAVETELRRDLGRAVRLPFGVDMGELTLPETSAFFAIQPNGTVFLADAAEIGVPVQASWSTLLTMTIAEALGAINVRTYWLVGDTTWTAAFHRARDAGGAGARFIVPDGAYTIENLAFNVAKQTWLFGDNAILSMPVGANGTAFARISADYVKLQNLTGNGRRGQTTGGAGGIVISATGGAGATGLGPIGVELDFRDFYDHDTFGVTGNNIREWRFTGKIRGCSQIHAFVIMNANHGDLKGGYADLVIDFRTVDSAGYVVRGYEVAAPNQKYYYGGHTRVRVDGYDNPPSSTSNCIEHRTLRDWTFDVQSTGGAMGISLDSLMGVSGGRLFTKGANAWPLEIQQTYGCGYLHFWGSIDGAAPDGTPRSATGILVGFGDGTGSVHWNGPIRGCKGNGSSGACVFINQSNTPVYVSGPIDINGTEYAAYVVDGSNLTVDATYQGGLGVLALLRAANSAGRITMKGRLLGSLTTCMADVSTSTVKTDDIDLGVDVDFIPSATVAITINSPAVVSWTDHRLRPGDMVQFTTSGALPTGLSPSTRYYVLAAGLTANNFRVSFTKGGAAVNTTGSQSGVHTGQTYYGYVPAYATATSGTGSIGNNLRVSRPIPLTSLIFGWIDDWKNKLIRAFGTGSPEGNLAAGVGSKYTRKDGGAGSLDFNKPAGTGNTGWVAEPVVASGDYTVTATGISNVDSVSHIGKAIYHRVGDIVTVSGRIDIDPTASATLTAVRMSLPVSSNFADSTSCHGVMANGGVAGLSGYIYSDATNKQARLEFISSGTASRDFYYTFQYVIKA